MHRSELIERTGSGSGAVQRELKRLASSGLVTIKRIGNQKHYQANPDSPVFEELCSLVKKTVALAEPIRAAIKPLAEPLGATKKHEAAALLFARDPHVAFTNIRAERLNR